MTHASLPLAVMLAVLAVPASAQDVGWQHAGAFSILTTPEGADRPATAAEENALVLVRFDRRNVDFSQAQAAGAEIALEFDQPVVWNAAPAADFFLDGQQGRASGGRAGGNLLTLGVVGPGWATTITGLRDKE